MKFKLLIWISIGLVGIFLLGGCAGKSEIDDLGYVMGIGIDVGEKPGYYALTYEFAIPQGGESGSSKPWLITVEAKSLREARTYINKILDRKPFIGTTRVIIIGEELAKQGFLNAIETAQRFYEFRRTLYVVVAKGKAADILNLELKSQSSIALAVDTLIKQSGDLSQIPVNRLGHILTVIATEGKHPLIAVVEKVSPEDDRIHYKSESGEPENIQLRTAGAFRQDKLELMLNESETQGALFFLNEVKQQLIAVEDGDLLYAGAVYNSTTKSKLITQDGQVGVHYKINIQMDLEEIRDKEFKSVQDLPEVTNRVQELVKRRVREYCEAVLSKAKQEQLDFLAIGRTIQMKDPKIWKEVKDDWETRLPSVPIEIEIDVKIRNTGTSYQSPGTNR